MIKHGKAPFLECSSKGDKRFSAFYARLQSFEYRTIEEIYQRSKLFQQQDGTISSMIGDWRKAKGQKAINANICALLYSLLWRQYITEHPDFLPDLQLASGLSDIFGEAGHCCQATELWNIRNASLVIPKVGFGQGIVL